MRAQSPQPKLTMRSSPTVPWRHFFLEQNDDRSCTLGLVLIMPSLPLLLLAMVVVHLVVFMDVVRPQVIGDAMVPMVVVAVPLQIVLPLESLMALNLSPLMEFLGMLLLQNILLLVEFNVKSATAMDILRLIATIVSTCHTRDEFLRPSSKHLLLQFLLLLPVLQPFKIGSLISTPIHTSLMIPFKFLALVLTTALIK